MARVTNEEYELAAEGIAVEPEETDEWMDISQLQVCCRSRPLPRPPGPLWRVRERQGPL